MKINDNCMGCGACKDVCPSDAIEEGMIYRIKTDACIEGRACEAACPNAAVEVD